MLENSLNPATSYDIHLGLTQNYAEMFAAKMERDGYEVSQLGDGWEAWGDDRGVNGNDVNTFHIVLRVPSVDLAISNAVSIANLYQDIVVRALRQNAEDLNELIVSVTKADNWDIRILDIFQDEHKLHVAKFRSQTVTF